MVEQHRSLYLAYVLRLWRDGQDTPWRVALQCARTGEQYRFADLAALFVFLEDETQNLPLSIVDEESG